MRWRKKEKEKTAGVYVCIYVRARTNVALAEIKIEESDSQLIPKVPRKFLTRWNFRFNTQKQIDRHFVIFLK